MRTERVNCRNEASLTEEQLALDASVVTTQHINEHEESPDLGRGYSGDNFHGARESICNATDYATAAACHAEYVYIVLAANTC